MSRMWSRRQALCGHKHFLLLCAFFVTGCLIALQVDFTTQTKNSHRIIDNSLLANRQELLKYNYSVTIPVHTNRLQLTTKEQANIYIDKYVKLIEQSRFLQNFSTALQQMKTKNWHDLLISVVDSDLIDFALNFLELSINRHKIDNYIFACLSEKCRDVLLQHGVHCAVLNIPFEDGSQKKDTDFGSLNYFIKTNIKTYLVLEALRQNVNVLIVDLDVIIMKNPFPYFTCTTCDAMFSTDTALYNTGFAYIKATQPSVRLYSLAWELFKRYHRSHDQAYIDWALGVINPNRSLTSVQIERLNGHIFPNGYFYFEYDLREFYSHTRNCPECIIIHNNYLGTTAAKRYRFKEHLLWHVDIEGYYTNASQLFLTYTNQPQNESHKLRETDIENLKYAFILGYIMGRIVVLPDFTCCNCQHSRCSSPQHRCSLLRIVQLKEFDAEFQGAYREHVFFSHPKIPAKFQSKSILNLQSLCDYSSHVPQQQMPSNYGCEHIRSQLASQTFRSSPVIEVNDIQSGSFLYSLLTDKEEAVFTDKFSRAFKCGVYEQWQEKPWV